MKLSDSEKAELLLDGSSKDRRSDFRRLAVSSRQQLTPEQYLKFLTQFSQAFEAQNRERELKRITGDQFKL